MNKDFSNCFINNQSDLPAVGRLLGSLLVESSSSIVSLGREVISATRKCEIFSVERI